MADRKLMLGLDFGTDTVRAVVIDVLSGSEESNAVAPYPRWSEGDYCTPETNQFRQHPLDYVEALETAVKGALSELPSSAGRSIAGIGIDTTGSTPCAVDERGVPLALADRFSNDPDAMFILWKDHTAVREAAEINEKAKGWGGIDFTKYEGGVYSSEWFWSKILHVLRGNRRVREAAVSWVEHCDWMPALLTGTEHPATLKRSRCAAGHKAMWHADWGGLPSEEFLRKVDPLLAGLRERLYTETHTADALAGNLTEEWGERLGLTPGIAVAVGAFDAHIGAVGGGITEGALTKIMGTSTCDVIVAPRDAIGSKLIRGICGQVDGSVIPGMIGLEAGQSAYGDVYAWFRDLLSWPLEAILPENPYVDRETSARIGRYVEEAVLARLASDASQTPLEETGPVALDWLNGRRTPFADQALRGGIVGLALGTSAPRVYRALVEATAFGAKAIVEQFQNEGVEIDQVIALGGIAKKSEFAMQVASDVLEMPIKVARSEQACALGGAMFAAVAAGLHASIPEAQAAIGSGFERTFVPDGDRAAVYRGLYRKYQAFGRIAEREFRGIE